MQALQLRVTLRHYTGIKRQIATGVVLLLGICWGCGTSEYERRLDARIAELKTESKFKYLASAVDVPDTRVSIRIPQDFNNTPLIEGAMIDGKPVDARRLKPGIINLPDLKATYEGFVVDANGGKQPYYLYVGVAFDPQRADIPRNMQRELRNKFNNATELTDFKVETPEGRELVWQRCRATGNQEFYYLTPERTSSFRQMPGLIELFFHDENDTLVILAWRMPSAVEQSINFQSWTSMTAGCVKVSPK